MYALRSSDGSLLWQRQIHDQTPSPPVLANGLIYVSTGEAVSALQATDGSLRWQHSVRAPLSPVASPEQVYARTTNGSIHALRASDGALLWHTPSQEAMLIRLLTTQDVVYSIDHEKGLVARRASDGSPLWHQPMIQSAGLYDCEVYGLQAGDGSLLWRWRTSLPKGGMTIPVVTQEAIYIGSGASAGLYALQINNGSILWHALSDLHVTRATVGERRL